MIRHGAAFHVFVDILFESLNREYITVKRLEDGTAIFVADAAIVFYRIDVVDVQFAVGILNLVFAQTECAVGIVRLGDNERRAAVVSLLQTVVVAVGQITLVGTE